MSQDLKYKVLNVGVAGLAIASLAPLLGGTIPVLELFSHFKVHYALISVVLVFLALKLQQYRAVMMALALIGMNAAAVIPFISITAVAGSDPQIKLINLNLQKTNPVPSKAIDFLRSENADIVVLEEITPEWAAQLKTLSIAYPHMLFCDDTSTCDLALLSKKPWQSGTVQKFSETGPYVITAEFNWDNSPFTLVSTHLDPPTPAIGEDHQHFHSEESEAFSILLRSIDGPLVVAGDFNATPWSPSFDRVTEGTELKRVNGGLLPTWPAQFSLVGIPIDQILTTSEFYGSTMTTGPQVGSDHLPLIAHLRVRG